MGVTIQFESHRNELAAIHEMEHDRDVLEYYDQPPSIKLDYQAKSGRSAGVIHTPDFFVIRKNSVGWEEWKTEEQLLKLAEKSPNRYFEGEDGQWRCPPGEQYATQFGMYYRLRSSAEIDWIYQRNILFLEDYFRTDHSTVSKEAVAAVFRLLALEPGGIVLAELLSGTEGITADDVYTLIATDQVYVDLRTAPLVEPQRVRVFRDQEAALTCALMAERPPQPLASKPQVVNVVAGESVAWDGKGWIILSAGETKIILRGESDELIELRHAEFENLIRQGKLTCLRPQEKSGPNSEAAEQILKASPEDLEEANLRYQVICPHLYGASLADQKVPSRTVRRWLARYRMAVQRYGDGYVGLLPSRSKRGNRSRKLPEDTLALMTEFIANDYETLKQKRRFEVYGALVRECELRGIISPSYKTFSTEVKRRSGYEQTKKRKGPRAAYQQMSFYWELDLTTPRHGDRPFEIGHIDHTELDVELVCSRTGRNLGRPWATFLTDAFSRRLLVVYLTFDPPSYRSCMMVLRECVSRHGRLPQTAVLDGGREFESTYFETLLARYECTKKTRPPAKARFGSVCERLFGSSNTEFIYTLAGNTQITRNVRQVTKSVNPKQYATWTLSKLYEYLCQWAYEVYDVRDHSALGQSPREAFTSGLARSGMRVQRLIPYDEDFRMFTLPTTKKGTAMVEPGHGIKILYIHYWSDAFRNPEVEKTQVSVRYDPFNAGIAYAYVNGQWVQCISEHYASFQGRSERELMLATAELRKRKQNHVHQSTITARKLADFLASVEAQEVLLSQRLHDAEAKNVFAVIEGDLAAHDGYRQLSRSDIIFNNSNETRESENQSAWNAPISPDELELYEDYK